MKHIFGYTLRVFPESNWGAKTHPELKVHSIEGMVLYGTVQVPYTRLKSQVHSFEEPTTVPFLDQYDFLLLSKYFLFTDKCTLIRQRLLQRSTASQMQRTSDCGVPSAN